MSLYLKYRPQQFSHLVGQDHIRVTLQNAVKKAQVSHAYLFCGPRGTGKTSTARLVAKAINCPNFDSRNTEPCNECDICNAINDGKLIDIIEIDAASNRGIDEIRELKETIKFAPTQVPNKVYIIDEVHMLTTEAFNALLKTLEEPPDNVFFILATTEVHKIPDTIISRCQRFDFRRMTAKTIEARLAFIAQTEGISIEQGVLEMIAAQVDGGLRDAIGLLEQLNINNEVTLENAKNLIGSTGTDIVASFFESILDKNEQSALSILNGIYSGGHDVNQFKKDFTLYLRSKLHEAIDANDSNEQLNIVKLIEVWQQILDNFATTIIPQLPIEVFIVKSCAGAVGVVGVKPTKKVQKVKDPVEVEDDIAKQEIINEEVPEEIVEELVVEDDFIEEIKDDVKAVPVENEKTVILDASAEKQWTQVVAKIGKATLKRSLQQSILRQKDNDNYDVVFNSDFHFRTVNTAENIAEIEAVVKEILKKSVTIHAIKEDIKITPAVVEKAPEPEKEDIVMEAMDMFEGEFIE